jgi:uncharacterized membrane protein YuzA (DUF378 family)
MTCHPRVSNCYPEILGQITYIIIGIGGLTAADSGTGAEGRAQQEINTCGKSSQY